MRLEANYFVRALREGNREEMVVQMMTGSPESAHAGIAADAETRLENRRGVRIAVDVAAPGELGAWTERHTAAKPKRFRDERR